MMTEISRFAPASFPDLPAIRGVTLSTGCAGIKAKDRDDVLLVSLAQGTQVAGVFTQSSTAAAPVTWCRQQLAGGEARALVANSGNANAFTGEPGNALVESVAERVATLLGCRGEHVFIASTGVIGEPIDPQPVCRMLDRLAVDLRPGQWPAAAASIMTTDTFAKGASRSCRIADSGIYLTGIAKGSGMIMPNMATMLCFVFTDAAITQPVLQTLLQRGVERSFNRITVDSDTSTNDTVLLFATGEAGHTTVQRIDDDRIDAFAGALDALLEDLALQVVKDGEGITKLITVNVRGADSGDDAHDIAMSVGNSPLVKTAIAGEDANWGRIVMAVGKSGAKVDQARLGVAIGGHWLARAGQPMSGVDIAAVDAYMQNDEIKIDIDVGLGNAACTIWASDLTHGYVSINGDYRS